MPEHAYTIIEIAKLESSHHLCARLSAQHAVSLLRSFRTSMNQHHTGPATTDRQNGGYCNFESLISQSHAQSIITCSLYIGVEQRASQSYHLIS